MLAADTAINLRILRNELLLGDLLESGVNVNYFDGASKEIHLWIRDHFEKYSKIPHIETANKQWGIELIGDEVLPEPNNYYIDKLKERWKRNRLKEGIVKTAELLKEDKLAEAEESIIETVKQTKISTHEIYDVTTKVHTRKEAYLKAKASKDGISGVPSGWHPLDYITTGWHPGELNIFAGRMGIGKSWAMIVQAEKCWRLGLKPMVVSMEMHPNQFQRRFDAVHFKIPFNDLRTGKLGEFAEQEYFKNLDSLKGKNSLLIVGAAQVRNPSDIEILIKEKKPDIVFIDGIYILGREGKSSMWERVTDTINELKIIAQTCEVPIIGSTQFNRKVKNDKLEAGLENLSFSDSVAQFADSVIGMFRTADIRLNKKMLFQIMKHREGEVLKFVTDWDFHRMAFDAVAVMDENGEQRAELLENKPKEVDQKDILPF